MTACTGACTPGGPWLAMVSKSRSTPAASSARAVARGSSSKGYLRETRISSALEYALRSTPTKAIGGRWQEGTSVVGEQAMQAVQSKQRKLTRAENLELLVHDVVGVEIFECAVVVEATDARHDNGATGATERNGLT